MVRLNRIAAMHERLVIKVTVRANKNAATLTLVRGAVPKSQMLRAGDMAVRVVRTAAGAASLTLVRGTPTVSGTLLQKRLFYGESVWTPGTAPALRVLVAKCGGPLQLTCANPPDSAQILRDANVVVMVEPSGKVRLLEGRFVCSGVLQQCCYGRETAEWRIMSLHAQKLLCQN